MKLCSKYMERSPSTSFPVKKILFSIGLASVLYVISRRLYKSLSNRHVYISNSESFQASLKKIPLSFKKIDLYPGPFASLSSLPRSTKTLLCENFLHSTTTHSTQLVIDENFWDFEESVLYVADLQTSGQGRTGAWQSNFGCLMFTFTYKCPVRFALAVQMVIPICIIQAILKTGEEKGVQVKEIVAKWPNDVYIQGRKISGVLVNSKSIKNSIAMHIGIGINVNNLGENICLEEIYPGVFERGRLLRNFLIEFEILTESLGKEGWEESLVNKYVHHWMHFGKKATLSKLGIQGIIEGITSDGVILVKGEDSNLYRVNTREEIEFMPI